MTIFTSDVFTPAKLPTITDVDRTSVSEQLAMWVRRGGFFVSLLGNTKLGKTTLVKSFLASLPEGSWSAYLPGQRLGSGADELWMNLARALGIPTSKETGLANSNKSTWSFQARLSVAFPAVARITTGAGTSGEDQNSESSTAKFDIDPATAVTEALHLLTQAHRQVVIAVDDFHFVADPAARRDLVIALRTLTDEGCSVILSTVTSAEFDPSFVNSNMGGRRKIVRVPRWDEKELERIAILGLEALRLSAYPADIAKLARESFGSPQIMQQLCLDLVENENGILERASEADLDQIDFPVDEHKFFQSLEDDDAFGWLKRLSAGPNPRKKRKKQIHPGPPPHELDGYQIIMRSLHELDSPPSLSITDLRTHVGSTLGISGQDLANLALELKARNLGLLASKDTTDALDKYRNIPDEDPAVNEEAAEKEAFAELASKQAIPQPVFEVLGEDAHASIRILDPLLSYVIKWHPEIIITAGRQ
jgi:hypothetical protein